MSKRTSGMVSNGDAKKSETTTCTARPSSFPFPPSNCLVPRLVVKERGKKKKEKRG